MKNKNLEKDEGLEYAKKNQIAYLKHLEKTGGIVTQYHSNLLKNHSNLLKKVKDLNKKLMNENWSYKKLQKELKRAKIGTVGIETKEKIKKSGIIRTRSNSLIVDWYLHFKGEKKL